MLYIFIDVIIYAVVTIVHEPEPGGAHLVVEFLVCADRRNPGVSKRVVIVEEIIVRTAERVAAIPQWGEMPFLTLATVSEQVCRPVIRLGLGDDFLNYIITGGIIKVEIAPKHVGISPHRIIHGRELVGHETLLEFGVFFGGVEGDSQHVKQLIVHTGFLDHTDLIVLVIVVEFNKIAPRGKSGIRDIVVKLGDVDAILLDSDGFGKEIKSTVITIYDYLHRLLRRSPGETYAFPEIEAHEILEVSALVIRMGENGEMLALGHTQKSLLLAEFQFEWLLGKSFAGPVASCLDFKGKRFLFRTDRSRTLLLHPLATVQVEPVFGIREIILMVEVFADDLIVKGGMALVGVHIYVKHRKST